MVVVGAANGLGDVEVVVADTDVRDVAFARVLAALVDAFQFLLSRTGLCGVSDNQQSSLSPRVRMTSKQASNQSRQDRDR